MVGMNIQLGGITSYSSLQDAVAALLASHTMVASARTNGYVRER
jgi:hypothetical protein